MEKTTDFDFLVYLKTEQIDPNTYYDANKIMKLKDKVVPEVGKIMDTVIRKLKTLTKSYSP